MSSGKVAAMASHCARLSLLEYIKINPEMVDEFINAGACGSLVVLKCKNEEILLSLYEKAKDSFPCSKFTDSGHIHGKDFDGNPILTGIAIGPALKEDMRQLTKKFRVWQ